jgi:hypothetical protein
MRLPKIRLTYANVASTLALFIALGGTSYAVAKLPRNSVGSEQIRTGAVGSSELRKGAVHSVDIRNGAVRLKDIRRSTRTALAGQTGPPGPRGPAGVSYFLLADAAGGHAGGNGNVIDHQGINGYIVSFPRSVAGCALVASPARVPAAQVPVQDPPAGSTVIVAHQGTNALVRTFDQRNQPRGLPFALIAAC